jgi:cytoskeletal protein CcmA (bactofilin family)
LKDGNKTISQRATRFLPVDMKDRLKSAFNRNSSAVAETAADLDASDYTAIFNPNRAAPAHSNPRSAGASINGAQLADASTRNAARQAPQDIEEAEIIAESAGESPTENSGFGAILKSDKSKTIDLGRARRQIEASGGTTTRSDHDHSPRPAVEAPADNSDHEEAVSQKSKSRFFGDFSSTESVRLKVEKRNEKRPEVMPPASAASPAEVSVLGAERGAVPIFALDDETSKLPTNGHQTSADGISAEPARSEQAHINLLEEYDSMDANEHESGNGAAARSDGNVAAAIVIERNSKFSGQLKFTGAITIEGQVEGELIAERIVIHEGGVVNASVDGNTVIIAGTVKGDVKASGELEILASGVVDGSVTAPAITVRRGGRVEGLCSIGVPRA